MDIQRYRTPPHWWSPKLSSHWFRFWKFARKHIRLKHQRVIEIEIRGLEHLQRVLEHNCGIMITPNHSSHADPLTLCIVAEKVQRPFYFMAAWQVFARTNRLRQHVLRQHGCFSVDREGTDIRAFRQAIDIVCKTPNPLVIFPEGAIYHVNDRVTPFRDGPAAIAITSEKRSDRPVVFIPCGIKYRYVQDPTNELIDLMGRLEEAILWRPRPDLSLPERIYRFAEAALGLKELEYLKEAQKGPLPERIARLREFILARLEEKYKTQVEHATLPVRVKMCRREAIRQLEENQGPLHEQAKIDLDDLFIVTQLFSYPGDYVTSKPSIERIAETLDKFEEDVLKKPTASIRGSRRAIVSLGQPLTVKTPSDKKRGIATLTEDLEKNVQQLLDGIE
jgi:hypothetical protein